MNKRMGSALVLVSICTMLSGVPALATGRYVDGQSTKTPVPGCTSQTKPCKIIQAGVDAAVSGDTVLVKAGTNFTYVENVSVSGKSITITNWPDVPWTNMPSIQPAVYSGTYASTVAVDSVPGSGLVLRNLKIASASWSAVMIWDPPLGATVQSCEIVGPGGRGVTMTGNCDGTRVDVLGNKMHGLSEAVREFSCAEGTIDGNDIYGNGTGIFFDGGSGTISHNQIHNNNYYNNGPSLAAGIGVSSPSGDVAILDNSIYNNTSNAASGITCYDTQFSVQQVLIYNNRFWGNTGGVA